MDLKGLNVLIDGYNLELPQGTGVKTYGITLINALILLGANVSVLHSLNRKSSKDSVLNEILFFDRQRGKLGKLGKLAFYIKNIPALINRSPIVLSRSKSKGLSDFHSEILVFDNKREKLSKFNLLKEMIKALSRVFYGAKAITLNGFVIRESNYFIKSNSIGVFNLPGCYKVSHYIHKVIKVTTKIAIPEKIDVWHATHSLPVKIKGAKKITTIHDLVPLRLPYTTLDHKPSYYRSIRDSLKSSDLIISVSENTKRDILRIFEINPDKIYVTYQPIPESTGLPNEENEVSTILEKYGLNFRRYILFVGALEPKKNIGRLIDAYAAVDTSMPLIIVGKKGWLWENEVSKRNLKNVSFLEYVPSNELKYLYTGAYCFVFPSLYEGFGLPPLEAMSYGCPVITSNVSSLPEVCGNAALYVDPYDVSSIKEALEFLLNNPKIRDAFSEVGKERAKLFSMENYINRLYTAYSKIL